MARSASRPRGRALGVTGGLLAAAVLGALATLAGKPFEGDAEAVASVLGELGASAASATPKAPQAEPAAAEPQPSPQTAPSPKTEGWAVAREPTPLDEVAIARVLAEAHERELGQPPSEARLGVAWAHIALENARGEGIENHNFGNLTIWEKEPGAHFVRILRERRPVKRGSTVTRWRWVEMRFRAFDTPVAGARAYWAHLVDKFPGAVERFDFGDAEGAGRKLARLGYASAFSMSYAHSLDNLYDEYRRRIAPQLEAAQASKR